MSVSDLMLRAFLPVVVLLIFPFPVAARAQSEVAGDVFGGLERVAKAYEIEIATASLVFPVKTTHGMIDGKNASATELRDYILLFVPEFSVYPRDLVRRSRLKRVVLCSDLSFAGQRRNAIPDYEHDTLYLDVSRGMYDKTYLRKVIHHEFFHIIDYRDDGNVYKDEGWAPLNPANFRYGSGGRNAQDLAETSVLSDKYPGFLNHYSTTAVEEDKAEIYANLIVDLEYVESRAKKDRVLDAKMKKMKEQLTEFCPAMNAEFWRKVRKMDRADK